MRDEFMELSVSHTQVIDICGSRSPYVEQTVADILVTGPLVQHGTRMAKLFANEIEVPLLCHAV
jgi:hypothetical protein